MIKATALMILSVLLLAIPCRAAEWAPIVDPKGQIFSSVLLATSPDLSNEDREPTIIGDNRQMIGAAIANPGPNTKVVVTVECPDFLESSTLEATLPAAGQEYWVFPVLRVKVDALQAMRQQRPVSLVFRLSISGQTSEKTAPATLRSVNDCPFLVVENGEDGKSSADPHYELFAAYVNEDHPYIEKILREALDTGIVQQFYGYQGGTPDSVLRQVFAVWNVMQRKGLQYSNITTVPTPVDGVASQHVRLLDDAIDNAQANCVDGSVLFASILRKIGVEPVLVIVPGHCFVAFYTDAERRQLLGLETTMMGQLNLKPAAIAAGAAGSASGKQDKAQEVASRLLDAVIREIAKSKGVDLKNSKEAKAVSGVLQVLAEAFGDDDSQDADGESGAGSPQPNHGQAAAPVGAGRSADFDQATAQSFQTFINAVQVGCQRLARDAAAFDDPEILDHELVSISEARAEGIMPIGYTKKADNASTTPATTVPNTPKAVGAKKKSKLSK